MSSPRKTSRRDFLSGRSAVKAISDLVPDETLPDPSRKSVASAAGGATYLVQVGRQAMACEFQVFLNAGQHPGATDAALAALDRVEQLEDQLTVYRDHSEVSRLNRAAAEGPVEVEPGLFDLLRQSVQLYEATGGAFDITAGPLAKVWGFQRREGRFPPESMIQQTLQTVGSQWLELDPAASTVRFQRPGVEINLGAIGKGYALDRAAEILRNRGVDDFLIHGGLSSVLAAGSRQNESQADRGWSISIQNPLRPTQSLGELWLRDRACGSSGSGNQFFHFQGRRYGHVIDPRSGYPAEDLISVTVLAPTAAEADALATGLFVLGADAASEYCRRHPELAALLILPGARTGSLELRTHGLDPDQWQPRQPAPVEQSGDPPKAPD